MSKERYTYHLFEFTNDKGKNRWGYEIRDNDDTIMFEGRCLAEAIEESVSSWATEPAAERNAIARAKELNK